MVCSSLEKNIAHLAYTAKPLPDDHISGHTKASIIFNRNSPKGHQKSVRLREVPVLSDVRLRRGPTVIDSNNNNNYNKIKKHGNFEVHNTLMERKTLKS